MKRTVFLALLCLTLTLLLTGCASNADTQPSPSVGMTTPMTSPNVTNMPSATNNMDGVLGSDAQQITTADDALTASKELRDAVEKLTEIDTATAVAIGNMALVGVTYDSSYQGELDDRIRGMVLDRAKAVNPAIQSVAVTDDPTAFSEDCLAVSDAAVRQPLYHRQDQRGYPGGRHEPVQGLRRWSAPPACCGARYCAPLSHAPLAVIGAMWGVLAQCLCTPLLCAGATPQRGWSKARSGFAYAAGRALCAAGISVGISLAESKLIFSLLPSISPWMAAALRLLIRLTALLLQGSLLLRIQKADRLHAAAGLLALLFGLLFYRL